MGKRRSSLSTVSLRFKLPPNAVYAAFVVAYLFNDNNAILRVVTTASCPKLTSTSIYRTAYRKHVSRPSNGMLQQERAAGSVSAKRNGRAIFPNRGRARPHHIRAHREAHPK
jgi:hypothetical protein